MDWTRSPWMRALALAASVALVVVHGDSRGTWFWVGVALVVLNVAGIHSARSRGVRSAGLPRGRQPGDAHPDPQRDDPRSPRSRRLDELLSVPGVAAALAGGPQLWRQVSYLDDAPLEPTTPEELAAFIWVENDDGWAIGLGDELKPYLDLDLDEPDDPVIRVLKAHPAVADAFHEDREVYRIEQRRAIGTEEFAELAARALVSHHVHVATRP